MLAVLALLAGLSQAVVANASLSEELQSALQEVADQSSQKYNCSFSFGLVSDSATVAAAAGVTDFAERSLARSTDKYAWGSCTKMVTGASVMRLISEGRFGLDDKIAPLIDPYLSKTAKVDPSQKFTKLSDIWGDDVSNVTVRQLMGMTDGIPDFDTAKAGEEGKPWTDSLRDQLYRTPGQFLSPTALMNEPWVAGHWRPCIPRERYGREFQFCYSSTNFMLLGFLLASQTDAESWQLLNQSYFLPHSLQKRITFANRGSPRDHGVVSGYDRTSYNVPIGQTNDHDNAAVDGVFAGWTASNIVASAPAMAELTWQIWGPPSSVAPKANVEKMIPQEGDIYGLAAFNLQFQTGQWGPDGHGYGHLGATYGYQSAAGFFPKLGIALVVASNLETNTQTQVQDAMCLAFNRVRGVLIGRTYRCIYLKGDYYGGYCKCAYSAEREETILV